MTPCLSLSFFLLEAAQRRRAGERGPGREQDGRVPRRGRSGERRGLRARSTSSRRRKFPLALFPSFSVILVVVVDDRDAGSERVVPRRSFKGRHRPQELARGGEPLDLC